MSIRMEIGKTFYAAKPKDWRAWLEKHHDKEPEIWLVYYLKAAGKPFVPYSDALNEALCFGWIDSTVKKLDEDSRAQRFTPRRAKSPVSEINKERIRRLIEQGKMTAAGLEAAGDISIATLKIPTDIAQRLKKDQETWKNFQKFPESYKRIRVSWIDMARKRPDEFKKRLSYFLKMTRRNKKFGSFQ